MDSKQLGAGAARYIAASSRIMDSAISWGIDAGIKAGMDYIAKERMESRKGRYDRRLHNTRLLLKNYRSLKHYAEGAVYKAAQVKENAVDILDGLDDYVFDDGMYIESIKKSQQRTYIIIKHIDEMLHYYRIECEQSGKDEEMRRYRIIMAYYITDEKMSVDEIAESEYIERRAVYRDIKAAMKPLSALIFGIDSMKLY